MTLWSGRLEGGMASDMAAFTSSLSFDRTLWHVDVVGSAAHVRGLASVGILSADEEEALRGALRTVAGEFESGTFEFAPTDEDIHTAIERRVTELAGPTGEKLHTGRSRNDQVATDLRLWSREACVTLAGATLRLVETLERRAQEVGDAFLPGYTHLQRAQPVLLSHHLRAHAWALLRDVDRFVDAGERADVSPLGAGALGGTSLPLDPLVAARELRFSTVFANSLDAVSDRDFVAELLFAASLCGVHLSRMGEELVVWSSAEFGFVELDDHYTTGSSMLPHKKNPDAAELARGKAGRLLGNLTGLLATLKGLPLAYNRDLQEDKEPLFDSVAQLAGGLAAIDGCYATAAFRTPVMATAAADEQLRAIELAELLVARGTPFRDAHRRIGALVARAHRERTTLRALVAAEPDLAGDVARFDAAGPTATSPGGGGMRSAEAQRAALASAIDAADARVAGLPRLSYEL